jgi:penicillin-binding protein 2
MDSLSTADKQSWLTWFLRGLLIVGFLILIGRLADLQIIRGKYYRVLAEGNRIRKVNIVAPRGKILASDGQVLVDNKRVQKRIVFDPEVGYVKSIDLDGAKEDEIIEEWVRDYRFGSVLGHVSGYLGEVSQSEVGRISGRCPDNGPRRLGSLTGRSGLEEKYECLLAGVDGEEMVEVDSLGKKVRTMGRKLPIAGEDLVTTIDIGLQKRVAEIMAGKVGSVIVTGKEGEILALYSSPSYDPNIFINSSDRNKIKRVLESGELPLFNRTISGLYHPGSVYKPVVAIAALEEGKIDKNFVYEDKGLIEITNSYGYFSYKNWFYTQYGGMEGAIRLPKAIARSTDTFFYKIGEMTGVQNMKSWSEKFKLSTTTGIDLPGEVGGLIPSPEWKMKTKGEAWFLGNTYHMSIGQGDVAVTPLGMHTATDAIAENGKFCPPYLVNKSECWDLGIKQEHIDIVKDGMAMACRDGGTGFTFFDFKDTFGVDVACKTGTAEVDNSKTDTHAWFTVFAPIEEPEIVVTILIERGGEGSKAAGPLAREVMDFYYNSKN